jgi:adenylate kinase
LEARHPFKVAVVTGIPGVGKTTVLRLLANMLEERKTRFLLLNLGDYMYKAASGKGLVKNRDEIRRLNHRMQLELQELAARLIVEHASRELGSGDILIIDTHALVKTSTGLWPGLPEHVVRILKPDVIFVVEASPEEILARQERDTTRYRRDIGGSLEEIRGFMEMARIAALISAVKTGSAVSIIVNPQNAVEKAAQRIFEILGHI